MRKGKTRVGCSHKKYYSTKEMVKVGIFYLKDRLGIKLYYYKCPHCQGYHLTKKKHFYEHDT